MTEYEHAPLPDDSDKVNLDEVRERTYRLGRTLALSAANEHAAWVKAGTLTRKHGDAGLSWVPGEVEIPEALTGALDLADGPIWGVYAEPLPLLGHRQSWNEETVQALLDRLEAHGGRVLVRLFADRSSASTTAHRANAQAAKALEEFREILGSKAPPLRLTFRAHTMPGTFGEFAYLEEADQ